MAMSRSLGFGEVFLSPSWLLSLLAGGLLLSTVSSQVSMVIPGALEIKDNVGFAFR